MLKGIIELALKGRMVQEKGIEECDSYHLGTEEDPRMVRVTKVYNAQEREYMLKLLVEYKDLISWSYEEIKTYDPEIITHDIPLKLDSKPFGQRKRPVNPITELLIMKEVRK